MYVYYTLTYLCIYVRTNMYVGLPSINSITVSGNMCFETSVNISWNSPSISASFFQEIVSSISSLSSLNVTMFEVSYQGMVSSTSLYKMSFEVDDTFLNFIGFNKSTNYTVTIVSSNVLGNGISNMSTFYIPGQEDFMLGRKFVYM